MKDIDIYAFWEEIAFMSNKRAYVIGGRNTGKTSIAILAGKWHEGACVILSDRNKQLIEKNPTIDIHTMSELPSIDIRSKKYLIIDDYNELTPPQKRSIHAGTHSNFEITLLFMEHKTTMQPREIKLNGIFEWSITCENCGEEQFPVGGRFIEQAVNIASNAGHHCLRCDKLLDYTTGEWKLRKESKTKAPHKFVKFRVPRVVAPRSNLPFKEIAEALGKGQRYFRQEMLEIYGKHRDV